MSRTTVAVLDERVRKLEAVRGEVLVSAGTVWNTEQLGEVIEDKNRYGELIKLELTIDHTVGKNKYNYIIWHYPLLNREEE